MFNKQGVNVAQEDDLSYESSDEDSFHTESDPDEPALLKELRRGSASQVLVSDTPKDMRKPTIGYWMNKIDEVLGED